MCQVADTKAFSLFFSTLHPAEHAHSSLIVKRATMRKINLHHISWAASPLASERGGGMGEQGHQPPPLQSEGKMSGCSLAQNAYVPGHVLVARASALCGWKGVVLPLPLCSWIHVYQLSMQ